MRKQFSVSWTKAGHLGCALISSEKTQPRFLCGPFHSQLNRVSFVRLGAALVINSANNNKRFVPFPGAGRVVLERRHVEALGVVLLTQRDPPTIVGPGSQVELDLLLVAVAFPERHLELARRGERHVAVGLDHDQHRRVFQRVAVWVDSETIHQPELLAVNVTIPSPTR